MAFDFIILGGGIVGLSTAMQLQQRYPNHKILVIEKETQLAQHQTGHNSGVIHAGIYYPPGSLKAQFCRAGAAQLKHFCDAHQVPYRTTGKLVVATNAAELPRLDALYQRSASNHVAVEYYDAKALQQFAPYSAGTSAILVKDTGIVDYVAVAKQFAAVLQNGGGQIITAARVIALTETADAVNVVTTQGNFSSRFLVACAGLQADRIAGLMGVTADFRIIPMRGEYYQLPERYNALVTRPIYPVPEPGVPFLGIHITPMLNGAVTVGPNAVMGWQREGYDNGSSDDGSPGKDDRFSHRLRDSWDSLRYPGFWRMAARYWQYGLGELRDSVSKTGYLRRVQAYCPQVKRSDLRPYPTGIRAQAVNRQGELLQDFLFGETPRSLHVCNAPSPAATACLPIGAYLCDKLAQSGRY